MKEIRLKRWDRISWIVSIAVFALVAGLRYIPQPNLELPFDIHILPRMHAILNSLAAVCLIIAFLAIKQKNVKVHMRFIAGAMALSIVFLLSYVFYHLMTEPTRFGGTGTTKTLYFILLISHIVLAAGVLPFILLTYGRGLMGKFEAHKKIARWTYPVWLYVSITGPICYLMLKPYYN